MGVPVRDIFDRVDRLSDEGFLIGVSRCSGLLKTPSCSSMAVAGVHGWESMSEQVAVEYSSSL